VGCLEGSLVWEASRSEATPCEGASIPKKLVPYRLLCTLEYNLKL
jgi:hypothetical protein